MATMQDTSKDTKQDSNQHGGERLGLRERKKLQTREAIVRASFELVIELGYEGATIAKIAERADVAPRTIHTNFSGKDAILLWHAIDHIKRLEQKLADGEGTTLERVRSWLLEETQRVASGDDNLRDLRNLRNQAFAADVHLQALEYATRSRAEHAIAGAELRRIGKDPTLAQTIAAEALGSTVMGTLLAMERVGREHASLLEGEFDNALAVLAGTLAE